jgi:hypothetical protein
MSENNGESRLDRIERMMEGLVDAHMWLERSQKDLLRSQILLTDAHEQTEKKLRQLAEQMAVSEQRRAESEQRRAESEQRMAESEQRRDAAMERMDDALTALMGTVDQIIRKQ